MWPRAVSVAALVTSAALSGCVPNQALRSAGSVDIRVSKLGLISNLPTTASNIYMGVTVFENSSEDVQLGWNFSTATIEEFKKQIEAQGRKLHDLSDLPAVRKRRNNWFETGYSLKFGLTPHVLGVETAAVLESAMREHKLNAILLLRPRQYNSDVPYGEAHPTGTFGVFSRGGFLRKSRTYTFVQMEGRLLTGSPPEVAEDLDGSNLVRWHDELGPIDMQSSEFKDQLASQIAQAVSKMLDQLGI